MLKATVIKPHTNGNVTYSVGEVRPVTDQAHKKQLQDLGLIEGEEPEGEPETKSRKTKVDAGPVGKKATSEPLADELPNDAPIDDKK